jgi:hypothetical protein
MSELNPELKVVKAAELFSLANEILERGGRTWVTVTGMSMFPFLAEYRDSVELSKTDFSQIKKRQIVLIRRANGYYVLHRVLKVKPDCFYMVGDAQQWIEGPLKPEQLQAVVTRINRKGRIIPCTNLLLRFCVFIWVLLIPFRGRILYVLRKMRRIGRTLFKG